MTVKNHVHNNKDLYKKLYHFNLVENIKEETYKEILFDQNKNFGKIKGRISQKRPSICEFFSGFGKVL